MQLKFLLPHRSIESKDREVRNLYYLAVVPNHRKHNEILSTGTSIQLVERELQMKVIPAIIK